MLVCIMKSVLYVSRGWRFLELISNIKVQNKCIFIKINYPAVLPNYDNKFKIQGLKFGSMYC